MINIETRTHLIHMERVLLLLWFKQLNYRKLLLILVLLQQIIRLGHEERGVVSLKRGFELFLFNFSHSPKLPWDSPARVPVGA